MADNSVNITGIDAGVFSGIPAWATESTLKKVENILVKSFGVQSKMLAQMVKSAGGNALTPAEIKKLNDELNKLIKNTKDKNKADADDVEARKKLNKVNDNHKKQIEASTLIFSKLTAFGTKLNQVFLTNMDTFDKLYASGVNVVGGMDNVSSGFFALQQLSAQTGVRYTELAGTLQKFSTVVNVFGINRFAKTLAASSAELKKFGFDAKESGELLGQYLEIQRGYAMGGSQSQEEVTQKVVQFGKRITSLSLATGKARDELLKQVDALSKSTEALILNATVGGDATESTLQFISGFSDQNVGQAFIRMMTDSIKPLNTTFMNFQKLGMGGFGQQMMSFANSLKNLDPTEAMKRTAGFVKNNQAAIDSMVKQANLYRQTGLQAEADAVLGMIAGLRQQAASFNSMTEEEIEKMQKSAEASKGFQTAIENLKATMQILFAPFIDVIKGITFVLEKLTVPINYMGKNFPQLSSGIGTVIGAFSVLAGALVAFKATVLASKAAMAVMSGGGGGGIGGLGGGLGGGVGGGKAPSGGRAGGRGRKGGAAGGGLIDMVGGLSKLSNPKILLGAGVLSGVVAILGLGFAAAAFTIGAALPTLAEGLSKFSTVDGKNLGEVGTGLLGLSAGLVAFTAAMTAASAGNIFSSIMEGVGGFFGNATIIEKMQQFADMGLGLKMAGDGLSGIANAFNTIDPDKASKVAAMLPSFTSGNISSSSLGTIRSSTVDSPSTVSSTDKPSAQASSANSEKTSGSSKKQADDNGSVNNLLIMQNGLIVQLVNSTNDLISVNKDILKYTKAQI